MIWLYVNRYTGQLVYSKKNIVNMGGCSTWALKGEITIRTKTLYLYF